jgi:hypothetical protein
MENWCCPDRNLVLNLNRVFQQIKIGTLLKIRQPVKSGKIRSTRMPGNLEFGNTEIVKSKN